MRKPNVYSRRPFDSGKAKLATSHLHMHSLLSRAHLVCAFFVASKVSSSKTHHNMENTCVNRRTHLKGITCVPDSYGVMCLCVKCSLSGAHLQKKLTRVRFNKTEKSISFKVNNYQRFNVNNDLGNQNNGYKV